MQIVTNFYPHVWPYMLSFEEGSPFRDVRVRKAANMAIDRKGLVTLWAAWRRRQEAWSIPVIPGSEVRQRT